jgi:hypothetical protein
MSASERERTCGVRKVVEEWALRERQGMEKKKRKCGGSRIKRIERGGMGMEGPAYTTGIRGGWENALSYTDSISALEYDNCGYPKISSKQGPEQQEAPVGKWDAKRRKQG